MAGRAGIQLDMAALGAFLNESTLSDLHRRGNAIANVARRNVGVDEGRLRASIDYEVEKVPNGWVLRVGTPLEYGLYHHEGTGIFGPRGAKITPKRGPLLAFAVKNNAGPARRRYSGGRTAGMVFARSVKGSPPNPFLRIALDAAGR